MLSEEVVKNLPAETGVYFFLKDKKPIYIGKALNIRARIASHFKAALLDSREKKIISEADELKFKTTTSDFFATLLEAESIRKYQPMYNFRGRDDKSYLYIGIDFKNEFPKVFTIRKTEINKNLLVFGPFKSQEAVLEIIRMIRKIIPFCTQKKISRRPCFYSKIGLCDPCPNFINQLEDLSEKKRLTKIYRNNIKKVIKILRGENEFVYQFLIKKIKDLTRTQKYEEAIIYRKKLLIYDDLIKCKLFDDWEEEQPLSKNMEESLEKFIETYFQVKKKILRIEGYDVTKTMAGFAITSKYSKFTQS